MPLGVGHLLLVCQLSHSALPASLVSLIDFAPCGSRQTFLTLLHCLLSSVAYFSSQKLHSIIMIWLDSRKYTTIVEPPFNSKCRKLLHCFSPFSSDLLQYPYHSTMSFNPSVLWITHSLILSSSSLIQPHLCSHAKNGCTVSSGGQIGRLQKAFKSCYASVLLPPYNGSPQTSVSKFTVAGSQQSGSTCGKAQAFHWYPGCTTERCLMLLFSSQWEETLGLGCQTPLQFSAKNDRACAEIEIW